MVHVANTRTYAYGFLEVNAYHEGRVEIVNLLTPRITKQEVHILFQCYFARYNL